MIKGKVGKEMQHKTGWEMTDRLTQVNSEREKMILSK